MEENDLKKIKHVTLDMDGTIYSGNRLFDTTKPFLDLLSSLGIDYSFLTNNSSKSVYSYQKKLSKMGIPVKPKSIYTSTLFAINYLKTTFSDLKRLYVLGTDSMREEVRNAGFFEVEDDPDIVLVAYDSSLTYHRLCKAAHWINNGAKFIATHPDPICPTEDDTLLIDCGCIVSCLEKATGKTATVLGKPNPGMLHLVADKRGLKSREIAMAGDRLETDIKMAQDAGAYSVYITQQPVTETASKADLSVPHLLEFGEMLMSVH